MTGPSIEIVRLGSVDSTQRIARDRARAGARSGTVVVATEQTAGRGRDGRSWFSPPGAGVWLTWIHRTARPSMEWPGITAAAALAVTGALRRLAIPSLVRWPNDIVTARGKVAGILADAEGDALLLGIGVNGSQRRESFPEELRAVATSVALERGPEGMPAAGIEEILGILVEELDVVLHRFEREGAGGIVADVWEISAVRGRRVRISLPGGDEIRGRAIGLGPAGELRIDPGVPPIVGIASGRLSAVEDV